MYIHTYIQVYIGLYAINTKLNFERKFENVPYLQLVTVSNLEWDVSE